MATATKPQELTAVFEAELFRNESNWCKLQLEDGQVVTGVVKSGEMVPGVAYRFIGTWKDHPKFGRGFAFNSFVQSTPNSRRGVVMYLEKFAPEIGPKTANKLCDLYGVGECIAVLKTDPKRVAKDTKLTIEQAEKAAQALKDIEGIQETKIALMDLFSGRGFYSESIDLAIKKWGAMAPEKIKRDPFCLLFPPRFPGAGFSRVDRLYQELGHPSDRLKRQVYCAVHTIEEDDSGSTWVPFATVERRINDLVTGKINVGKACKIATRCGLLLEERRDEQQWVAVRRIGQAEIDLAKQITELLGEEWRQSWKTSTPHQGSSNCEDASLSASESTASLITSNPQSDQHYLGEWDF